MDNVLPGRRRGFLSQLFGALSLASLCWAGFDGQAAAQLQGPMVGRVLANCTLNQSAVNFLNQALTAAGITQPRVDFVVVYSLANSNDGQPVPPTPPNTVSPGFTGPVLCSRLATVVPPVLPTVTFTPVLQTDPIPASGTVDLLGIENALITQYKPAGGAASDTEKQFCHTVGAANDCFRISD